VNNSPFELSRIVIQRCLNLGFADAGVCVAAASSRADEYRSWIAQGKHGEMAYLARNIEKRLDVRELMPGARAVVMVADQYATRPTTRRTPNLSQGLPLPPGRIARYAQGDDYHEVMKKRLHALCDALRIDHPTHEFRAFVDTAPVLEREHAARAGLGWIGKHTLLINPLRGSWLFLGGVVTTLPLEPPPEKPPMPDHCGTCTRCIDACPTGAIASGGWSIDARRCISYLTIEHRSEIPAGLSANLSGWIYGCDVCQEVCPHNSARDEGAAVRVGETLPAYSPRREHLDPAEVLGWTEEDRRRAFEKSAMKRATLAMMKRNAGLLAPHHDR